MRTGKLITMFFLLISLNCSSQKSGCNQKQKYGNKSTIPKEVCIPLEHVISNLYPSVDLNGDGLEDFVFDHHKEILENGDSIFLSIYLQE